MGARARAHERSAAIGLAVLAHLLLLAGLIWSLKSPPAPAEVVIALDLEPDARSPRPRRSPLRPSPTAAAQPSPRMAAPAPPDVAPSPIPPAVVAPAPPSPLPSAALGAALRRSLGCTNTRLSETERRDCELRLAGATGRGAPLAGVDPLKLQGFAAEQKPREPFLARTPKDNCVPRVQEKDMPGGPGAAPDKDWRAGVACALSF